MARMVGSMVDQVDQADQVCTSKIAERTMDESMVTMFGVARRSGLPCWYECKVSADDPGMRDLQFSREKTVPKGLIAQNASVLVSLLEDALELLLADKEECEGGRKLRAALHTAMGLKRTATMSYEFDEELETAEYCRNDSGAKVATTFEVSVALQEPARAGLGHLGWTRPGLIYTADCGLPTAVVVDKFLASITPSDKAEVVDAVVCGGMDGGVMEVAKQLGKVRLHVAVTPAAHARIAESLPAVWERWEAQSQRELWLGVENVSDSNCAGNWQSMSGINWQVNLSWFWLHQTNWASLDLASAPVCAGVHEAGLLRQCGAVLLRRVAGLQREACGRDRRRHWSAGRHGGHQRPQQNDDLDEHSS